jgi:nucleoside-diphosphate-sugar epimerase
VALVTANRRAKGDVRDSVASLDRSRELLGYEPSVDLRDGLRITAAHFAKLREEGRDA